MFSLHFSVSHTSMVLKRWLRHYSTSHKICTWFGRALTGCGFIILLKSYDLFTHVLQVSCTATGTIIWWSQWQCRKPGEHGYIKHATGTYDCPNGSKVTLETGWDRPWSNRNPKQQTQTMCIILVKNCTSLSHPITSILRNVSKVLPIDIQIFHIFDDRLMSNWQCILLLFST